MSKSYPSLTRLQPGERFTSDRYGVCTVLSVKRARNNRGIQPYDVVKVSTTEHLVLIPMYSRPEVLS